MKNGMLEKSDSYILMGMYRKLEIDGNLREPFTPKEMVLLYSIANSIQKGIIRTYEEKED